MMYITGRAKDLTRTVTWSPYGDSWTHQTLIPRPFPGGFRQAIAPYVRAVGCGGPGQVFHRAPVIVRRTRRYVVIHQSGGFDV